MPVVMGTAGHIDHGKTTLVKALTGIDCDRLGEEKRRGITIELGFAFLDLPEGKRLSIVDVPGHEKFVKNMVSGASGIDFVMLVIAADEGVMPQTREHLEICSLLGIRTGLVALTKTDMVDEEWLALVQDDVAEFLEGSFLESAPVFPVSATGGQGLTELRAYLAKTEQELRPERRSDIFRLPVDRVFTMRGHGTVVTGTMISGSVSLGDEVELVPSGLRTKVRGLQSHGATVETAPAGRRTAVNLAGLDVEDIQRGEVLALPDTLHPSPVWDVRMTCLSSAPTPLKNRTEVHFHHGSRETLARLYFPDRDKLMPGETCVCQVRFTTPLAGVFGDRCVVRSFSPLRTVAGGMVLSPVSDILRRKDSRFADKMTLLEELADAESDRRISIHLALAGDAGCTFSQLCVLTDMESKRLEKSLVKLGSSQQAFVFDKEEKRYVDGDTVEKLSGSCVEFLGAYHRKEPLKQGLVRGELASGWGRGLHPKLVHFITERLIRTGKLVSEQDLVRLPDHAVSLAADQEGLRNTLAQAYRKGGTAPPNLQDVLDPLGLTFKEAAAVFKLLQNDGVLVRVKENMFYDAQAIADLQRQLEGWFAANEDIGPNEFRDLTGLSRKYVIPLLEYFDRERVTMRVGDRRVLRKKS
ncbi:selenocysteine-specific translation elongation factor [Oleidesulfovibrio sp.]|uniref:selenocysteine-specific translation elongation factor n=1 Tax=Oleidesulfovibrio sp. TaxID=2909707 RepID=UPI003A897E13